MIKKFMAFAHANETYAKTAQVLAVLLTCACNAGSSQPNVNTSVLSKNTSMHGSNNRSIYRYTKLA
jgi:hypothetical protein